MILPHAGHLLQYQISLIAVSNPQKLTALRSATHSTCDSGLMLAPSHSLGSVFYCLQISGQSLEAIAFIVSNLLVGFQHCACMWHADSMATRSPTHSHPAIVHHRLSTMILPSLLNLWAQRSHKKRPSLHTAHYLGQF